jgi:hypothetical protein
MATFPQFRPSAFILQPLPVPLLDRAFKGEL